ncbi:hypothetical protein SAMN05216388_102521 [Halorientalis persicus]|uniref:Uncharacterized protein n=1 Tax=Halorientalis persicus TaxID=1367881 RepID=A0A1H8U201_9EURY|nr:hypothetical protein [Halorientalis persicus]SEO97137.1 hypothetical protein SAMN05216388_102521 [Halorientalis persicus]
MGEIHDANDLEKETYEQQDVIERAGPVALINSRMTKDEVKRDLDRVDRLQQALDDATVANFYLYGQLRRVGALIEIGHDPLNNGFIASNVEGFTVDAVNPRNSDQVFVRFQENKDSDGVEFQSRCGIEPDGNHTEVLRIPGISDGRVVVDFGASHGRPRICIWNEAPIGYGDPDEIITL